MVFSGNLRCDLRSDAQNRRQRAKADSSLQMDERIY